MNADEPVDTDEGGASASAGEYVLGTLGAAERLAFEARLHADAALQAEVYAWQDRLLGLARRVAPAATAPGDWPAIEARLDGLGAPAPGVDGPSGGNRRDRPPNAAPAGTALPAGRPASAAANDPQGRRLRRWQLTSALAIAASLLLATLLLVRNPAGPPAGARYLAVLQSPTSQDAGWIVEATAGGQVRLIPVDPAAAAAPPAGKSLQFWTKAEGAAGPTSLGLVTAGVAVSLPAARLPALGPRQLFELTLEPAAGSPLPRPTGPVLYVGRSLLL